MFTILLQLYLQSKISQAEIRQRIGSRWPHSSKVWRWRKRFDENVQLYSIHVKRKSLYYRGLHQWRHFKRTEARHGVEAGQADAQTVNQHWTTLSRFSCYECSYRIFIFFSGTSRRLDTRTQSSTFALQRFASCWECHLPTTTRTATSSTATPHRSDPSTTGGWQFNSIVCFWKAAHVCCFLWQSCRQQVWKFDRGECAERHWKVCNGNFRISKRTIFAGRRRQQVSHSLNTSNFKVHVHNVGFSLHWSDDDDDGMDDTDEDSVIQKKRIRSKVGVVPLSTLVQDIVLSLQTARMYVCVLAGKSSGLRVARGSRDGGHGRVRLSWHFRVGRRSGRGEECGRRFR